MRFLVLFLLALGQIINCIGWIGFAAIVDKTIFAYKSENLSTAQINYMSMIFLLMFVFVNFISVWVIENKGIRASFLIGVSIQVVGFWFRQFINESFNYCLIGQTILAIG
jgi:hypothetical protein